MTRRIKESLCMMLFAVTGALRMRQEGIVRQRRIAGATDPIVP
jgi:hypothetical protein